MPYLIKAAYRRNKGLTSKQRSSPHFEMEPMLGARVVRMDHPVTLSDEEFALRKTRIDRLLSAEAIEIVPLGSAAEQAPKVEEKAEEQAKHSEEEARKASDDAAKAAAAQESQDRADTKASERAEAKADAQAEERAEDRAAEHHGPRRSKKRE